MGPFLSTVYKGMPDGRDLRLKAYMDNRTAKRIVWIMQIDSEEATQGR